MNSRPAAVAGMFYPADPVTLQRSVVELLTAAPAGEGAAKAIIAPHAGYRFSGATAAHAYKLFQGRRSQVRRVVLMGPAHSVYLRGMALPSFDAFSTPLGDVPIDKAAVEQVLELPGTQINDEAHASEHSLEVHLPFLQTVLDDFLQVPIVVGACTARHVEAVLEALWGGDETAIVVSSDLSHYHAYSEACEIDASTTARIEALDTTLHGEDMCGAYAVNGLMLLAKEHGLDVRTLEVCNSGDTSGDKFKVVGYGAYAIC